MDLLLIAVYFVLLALAIQVIRLLFADGDLRLMWKERFGQKPGKALRGKVIWITGASTGIGEYLSYEMAKAGCRLVLTARSKELLEAVKDRCLKYGRMDESDILVLPLDLTDIGSHDDAVSRVIETFDRIDVLVNNAGRSQRAWVLETELAVEREMIELNVIAQINLTKKVLPHMIRCGQGHVVVTSSLAGKMGVPYSATYCLTKFAIQGWFQSLAIELSDKNIGVSIICPGPVVSNLPNIAFTAKAGQMHGGDTSADKNRMSTERCAELMAIAIANKLDEVWICRHPTLIFVFLNQYMPTIAKRVMKMIGVKTVMKMREGQ